MPRRASNGSWGFHTVVLSEVCNVCNACNVCDALSQACDAGGMKNKLFTERNKVGQHVRQQLTGDKWSTKFLFGGWKLVQQPHAACHDICAEAAKADTLMHTQHHAESEQLHQYEANILYHDVPFCTKHALTTTGTCCIRASVDSAAKANTRLLHVSEHQAC